MTTITREQLHERARRKVKELEFAITQSAFTSIRDGLNEELELARIALASLEVAPVGEVSEKRHGLVMDGTVDLGGKSTYRIIKGEKAMKRLPLGTKFYIAPPAPVVDADPVVFTDERNLHHIAMGRETSLIWGKQNQEVGDIPLYRHAQPMPVVPDEMATSDDMNLYQKSFAQGYNACRAAMLQGAEAVSNRDELPLDYLQGHKDGLEWAAQLAEANHPQTGDWLYDDPIELARAIRKGPDMPTVQTGNSPATPDGWISCCERMPDNDESKPIAIFTGKCLGQGMFVATYDDDGFFDYWEGMEIIGVSHWMSLPAAPQK
ncbi:TPA: DUF551 domain-containing protein [Salmonella enterica]|nr:DUF551 domain-containing protein [Salmonella enterica]